MKYGNDLKIGFLSCLLLASLTAGLLQYGFVPSAQASPDPDVVDYNSPTSNNYYGLKVLYPSSETSPSAGGQSFTSSAKYNLTVCNFSLSKVGLPTGMASAHLYAHSGGYGSSSIPTGSPLATSDELDVSTLTTTKAWYSFNFSSGYELQTNTYYCIVFTNPTSGTINSSNYVKLWGKSDTHDGNSFRYRGTYGWQSGGSINDVAFYVYGEPIMGNPEYFNIRINSTRAGNTSTSYVNWTCSGHTLSGYYVEHNNTGVMTNYTWTSMTGMENRSEYTFTFNGTEDNLVCMKTWCNDSNNDWTVTPWRNYTATIALSSDLYTEGRHIKQTSDDKIIQLRGFNRGMGHDHPAGNWMGKGETGWFLPWSESRVKDNLAAIQCWNANALRTLLRAQWWWENTTEEYGVNYRQNTKDLANWTREYGIYFIPVTYAIKATGGQGPAVPYPPSHDGSVFSDEDEFIDYVENVTLELRDFPNVIHELYNEPHGEGYKDGWMNVTQYCIDRIRRHSDCPVIVQFYYQATPSKPMDTWVDDYLLQGSNIIYSTHQYRWLGAFGTGTVDERPYTYTEVKSAFQTNKIDWVGDTQNKPLLVGEFGVNLWLHPSYNLTREIMSFENQIRVLNEWNMSYLVWVWRGTGTQWDILTGGKYVPRPRYAYSDAPRGDVGVTFLKMHFDRPTVITCGNETVSGYPIDPYYYSRNISYTETWFSSNGTLRVNTTETEGTLRIFWPVWNKTSESFLTVTDTVKIRFENGTQKNATDYYDSTHGLISFSWSGGAMSVGVFKNASESENQWQMTFNHLDWDSNVVDSKISWQLYNASQQLSFTEGAYTLLDGTYNLKTYYHDKLINTSSFNTATYGNTTVDVNLMMKAHQSKTGGYIFFNDTISSIPVYCEIATNLTFAPENATSNGYLMGIDVTANATYVKRNGQTWTNWTYYAEGYILINVTELSATWELQIGPASTLGDPYFVVTLYAATLISGGLVLAYYYRRKKKTRTVSVP